MQINAPAKVNLFLAVSGGRPDGYRELETVIQAVSLCDTIDISPAESVTCTCSDPSLPVDRRNLAMKAAALLKVEGGGGRGASIHIKKRIPVAGGMGGGSSDAAAVLTALNDLWGLGRSRERLMEIAAELGSDAPFFVDGRVALCRGRGEIVEPVESAAHFWVVLVNPRTGLSTKDVYAALGDRMTSAGRGHGAVIEGLRRGDLEMVVSGMYNELDRVACRLLPLLEDVKESLLKAGCAAAMVSGSGPTVFGLSATEDGARRAAETLGQRYPDYLVEIAEALNR